MSSFGEKVVQKLDKFIPESDIQSFKKLSVKCLREGVPSGLEKLKEEIKSLPANPSDEIVKEIEDMFNDYTVNTLSFVYQNQQAAAMAGVLTKIADKIYLDDNMPTEHKTKVMEDTRQLLSKLEKASKTNITEEMINEILQHTGELQTVVDNSESLKEVINDLAETVKELATAQTE